MNTELIAIRGERSQRRLRASVPEGGHVMSDAAEKAQPSPPSPAPDDAAGEALTDLYKQLAEELYPELAEYCRALLRRNAIAGLSNLDAEDLVQDAFLKLRTLAPAVGKALGDKRDLFG